jgi:protein gp37
MNRTKIEWTDFTWNPVTGCLHRCPYCYGRKIANRFRSLFPNGYKPTFHPERLKEPYNISKNFRSKNPHLPKGSAMIFTVSMGDLFGLWMLNENRFWVYAIFNIIWDIYRSSPILQPRHQFQILTKAPQNIELLVRDRIPPNVWIGTTVEDQSKAWRIEWIQELKHHGIKFVSFEPLLSPVEFDLNGIDWIIIGTQTNPYKPPEAEWVHNLIEQAKDAGAAVFLKDNLRWPERIQEFPTKEVDAQ